MPEGAPAFITWRRVKRRIVRAEGPERIAPEWWKTLGQTEEGVSDARMRTRDYYRLEDQMGAGYWVYREGLYTSTAGASPRWFMHGLFA